MTRLFSDPASLWRRVRIALPRDPASLWRRVRAVLARSARHPRLLERTLFAVSFALLGYCAFALVDARVYDSVQTWRLARMRAEEPPISRSMAAAAAVSPITSVPWIATATRAEADENRFVGRLEIARLGVEAAITEGIGARSLRRAVGHVPGTAFPGELGNVAIAGHRDRHFRGLQDVQSGDVIHVESPDGDFDYVVSTIAIVEPDAVYVLAPTPDATLTLVTCYPFAYIGDAPQRFIVRARLAPAATVAAAGSG